MLAIFNMRVGPNQVIRKRAEQLCFKETVHRLEVGLHVTHGFDCRF